ncbi:MAG: ATP-binding protein [Bacteroidota bacterium]
MKNKKLSSNINYCHITYTDNGMGFDPQYNERIFEVFQRLHRQEDYEGTGMGLAICRRVIENHKGSITASGKLDKGSRFDIYIPAL